MGKPCITTDAPGCRHTVDHNVNGLLVKVADAKDLEDKISQFIESPVEVREEMGRKAREKAVAKFSTEIIVEKYINLLRTL
jgi:glycosyltransferase involved in cell wall biosynthesis